MLQLFLARSIVFGEDDILIRLSEAAKTQAVSFEADGRSFLWRAAGGRILQVERGAVNRC